MERIFIMNKNKYLLLTIYIIFTAIGLLSCGSNFRSPPVKNFTEVYLLDNMPTFSIDNPIWNNSHRERFFKVYYEHIPNLKTSTGLYFSHSDLLAAHLLEGENTDKGTLIMIHGYRGSLTFTFFQHLAKVYIERGYRVVLLNLPGHEFSGGYRGSVNDFTDYSDMINSFFTHTEGQLGEEVIMLGHSTGAISIYDAYIRYPETMRQVDATVLLSPFIGLNLDTVFAFSAVFIDGVLVEDYKAPMQFLVVPGSWIKELRNWSNKIKNYPLLNEKLLLVFGSKDEVIKLQPSIDFYSKKIPAADVKVYEGQDHSFFTTMHNADMLQNDYKQVRKDVDKWINNQLATK